MAKFGETGWYYYSINQIGIDDPVNSIGIYDRAYLIDIYDTVLTEFIFIFL